ncbi:aminopeptidase [Paucibacter sp. KCTC 42545]|uniref:aminopeptidase n=1 Tax=Paucibacter sp. KCTC 42545 TaxID=1768242 RepID=UPI000733BA8B|nr:aminopeptidase [Paucibacter sp. KCTC 42545]ALT76069.1 aminopeptidase [Paucibacter sp. KCTC 42545]
MRRSRWLASIGACGLALLALLSLGGCAELGYLRQSAAGHLRLMAAAKPVDEFLAQPDVSADLRQRLLLSQRMRSFAVSELKLPDNSSYRRYADLGRPAVVWNVVAAPELSLQLKTWCFPVMGCVGYRGYFDQAQAQAFAAELQRQDASLEVQVYPVPAYSTLGWSNWVGGDPLLNTFIRYPEGELAGLIFHELAHQVAYVADDTPFNEAFATAVERRGAAAWLSGQASPAAREAYAKRQLRREQFRALTGRYRQQLAALYAGPLSAAEQRAAKAALLQDLRQDYERLKAEAWGGDKAYDAWFAQLNNASLAILSAYTDLSPAFEAMLDHEQGDWQRFYVQVQRLAALPKSQRLQELLNNKSPGAH